MNLVFASGFLVPQHIAQIDYFHGLEAHLKGKHETLFPDVSALGSSKDRADALAKQIAAKFPQGPIHIVAHSMGGLDGRTLIGGNLQGLSAPGRVRSLTTLSTPHHGSPVADLLLGEGAIPVPVFVRGPIDAAIAALGIPVGALRDLTTKGASAIPDAAKSHPDIHYRSYFASGRPGFLKTSVLLAPTHSFISLSTGQPNDGLVTLESAKYGEFQQPFWECDHADITGHDLDNLLVAPKFEHLAHIDAIISELAKLPNA